MGAAMTNSLRSTTTSRLKYSVQAHLRLQKGHSRGAIVFVVYHKNERLRFSLGQTRIELSDWDAKRQRVKISSPDSQRINNAIDEMLLRICQHFETLGQTNSSKTLETLKSIVLPSSQQVAKVSDKEGIIKLFKRFMHEHSNKGRQLSKNTLKSYHVVLNSWQEFERNRGCRYSINDFRMTDIGASHSRKIFECYQRYLIEIGPSGVPCTDNTVRKYVKILSTFLRWCESDLNMPLVRNVNVKGEIVSKHSVSLTQEEVSLLETCQLKSGSKLFHVRNMMILALYTGLRHSEWTLVLPSLWREPSQLITSPKTGKSVLVVHRDAVRMVLQQYEKTGIPLSIRNIQKINWIFHLY